MSRRTQVVTAALAVATTAAAVLVAGPGFDTARVRMSSGSVWLASNRTGTAVLADGATAELVTSVRVDEPGAALSVAQQGSSALVMNQETGVLSRIDSATLDVTRSAAAMPASPGLVVVPARDVAYGVDVRSGEVVSVDPQTVAPRGRQRLAESLRPDSVVVDDRGRLWAIDDTTGDLVWLDGDQRRTRSTGAKSGRLALTAGRLALVDPERGTAELLSAETGAVTRSVRTGLRAGDTIAVSGSSERSRVLIANSTRGELVVCAFDTGSCDEPVQVGVPGDELGPPLEIDAHAVVPNHSTGQATIVDLTTGKVDAQRELFAQPTRFELIARDGVVFFNDPNGSVAGVLDLAGEARTISKYSQGTEGESPTSPDRPGTADQVAAADRREHKPDAGLTGPPKQTSRQAPVSPAPIPTASIAVSPANRGAAGDEFELTMLPRPAGAAAVRWSFGDGSEASGGSVRHSWTRPGVFTVRAEATLPNGTRTQAETAVTIDPEQAPLSVTQLVVRRPKPVIGERVSFSADSTGKPDRWSWSVTRPGTIAPEVTADTPEFGHRFTVPGVYTVSLTITSGTRTAQSSRKFTVARGAVEAWGDNSRGQTQVPLAASSGVMAISAGFEHSLALKTDGSVVVWGDNTYGQAEVPADVSSGVVAISAGGWRNIALKEDGSVVAWGDNVPGWNSVPPHAQRDVVAISTGMAHSLALKRDGSVVAWGDDHFGETVVPAAASRDVVAISAGITYSLALKADGSVVAWGQEDYPDMKLPPEASSGVVAIDTGDAPLAMKADGSLFRWGSYPAYEIPPAARTGVASFDTSHMHFLALKTDGSVISWGEDNAGETSVPPAYGHGVLAVAAGSKYSMVLLEGLD
ncbi:PKD domain-containing protein [Lentzea sp. NPDC034063]|uniref:PKD domain-containing protein n=1 Tax=unclassified Lentzea TaxID=2643253 RepID=UPI0033D2BBA0